MNKSKSSLFLMELILTILVFSIASAVCIQIFVKAHLLSKRTQTLNEAVTICTSSAELFYGFDGDLSRIKSELDISNMGVIEPSRLTLYYDDNFGIVYPENGIYSLTLNTSTEGNMLTCVITFTEIASGENVYSVPCSLYVRSAAPNADDMMLPDAGVLPDAGIVPDADVVGGAL